MPCKKGRGPCMGCGLPTDQQNEGGKNFCPQCAKKSRAPQFAPAPWNTFEDIDWEIVAKNYYAQAEESLRRLAAEQGNDPVYGLILQLAQNWALVVHANTDSGKAEIPQRVRKVANWTDGMSDAELLAKVGFWYPPSWKFESLGLRYQGTYEMLDQFHHDCFEHVADLLADDSDNFVEAVNSARQAAALRVLESEVLASLAKTDDFKAYIVDDDGLDLKTGNHPGPAEERGG